MRYSRQREVPSSKSAPSVTGRQAKVTLKEGIETLLLLQRTVGNRAIAAAVQPHGSQVTADESDGTKISEKVFNDVTDAIKSNLDKAWADSTTTWREWGGRIIRNIVSGEITVDDYRQGQRGMMVEWSPLPYKAPEGYELIGEFHTHPYSPKEVKKWQKDVPSFTGEGVGFDTGDILGAQHYFKQDYVSLVKAGNVTFGFVVHDAALANDFASYGSEAIDDADWNILWDIKKKKVTGSYTELSWQKLATVVEDYKMKTGKDAGIHFFRKIDQ